MTNKEFAFNYAGKEFMYCGNRVILVGFNSKRPGTVIVSPLEGKAARPFCLEGERLDRRDVITYGTGTEVYRHVDLDEIVPVTGGNPRTAAGPATPGGRIARYGGRQGTNRPVTGGSVSAVHKGAGERPRNLSPGVRVSSDVSEKVW